MDLNLPISVANVVAALLAVAPYLAAAFYPRGFGGRARLLPVWLQASLPALLCLPYVMVACAAGVFQWGWFALYVLLPVAVAALLGRLGRTSGTGAGRFEGWREFLVLAVLGLAVDLRWFERAWPAHLAIFNKMLLLDAGIYGFIALRDLEGTGFDLRLRLSDAATGLKDLAWYTPIALALGLGLGFLHLHMAWPSLSQLAGAWLFTFFFIAVPEELFFRGWLQNLIERRLGRSAALLLTAVLFGLSHWNKRTTNFNWQYVVMAALAGIFYGRAWRAERRIGASALTHAMVDAVWGLWLR